MDNNNKKEVIYDLIGELYSEKVEKSAYNAFYERPALLKLIGDVKNLKVLDVGCGNGFYSEHMLNLGVRDLVAFDISSKMIQLFKKRLPHHKQVFVADILEPLDFAKDEYFDLVICPLVLHYVRNWEKVFLELYKKLKKGGKLIFSTSHPFCDINAINSKNYFEVELIEEYWPTFKINMLTYRRSLSSIILSFEKANFKLSKIIEPKPIEELNAIDKELYNELSHKPVFICFELLK